MSIAAIFNRDKSNEYVQFYTWTLTASDATAEILEGLGSRNDKSVQVYEASGGYNGATVQVHGDCLANGEDDKTAALVDSQGDVIAFTSDTRPVEILPGVNRIKPVVSSGTLGANGVVIALMVTAGFRRFR